MQESGRGGCGGNPVCAVLFYKKSDLNPRMTTQHDRLLQEYKHMQEISLVGAF